MSMTDTIFTLSDRDDTLAHIADAMTGYEADLYAADIAAGKLEELVELEWKNVWTQGDNVYATAEAAAADATRYSPHVLEITRDDVRAALLREFATE
ncbi:MAG TPA: hypothetical protein PKN52_11155 [Trueperaceae bacterium]|nr:hypothetical protein [Trueperaceae bacterium]